ncbi:hypothetical protein C2G38_2052941, partial [Gigaspora rosea]
MHYFQIRINYVINITRLKKPVILRIFFPSSTLISEFSSLSTCSIFYTLYTVFSIHCFYYIPFIYLLVV